MIREVRVENLALMRGDRLLFQGLDFSLNAGQAISLVGRNGAGKTSLLRAIAGFLRPWEGAIAFEGETGPLEPEDARSRGLHMAGHQDGLKASRSAETEFLFQARWTGASEAGIAKAREALDLDVLFDLEVRKLSAGQRRRLSLGRLLASQRPLWLLDEPLAPLDVDHRRAFGALMAEHLANGGMILAAVHDPLPIDTDTLDLGGLGGLDQDQDLGEDRA
ncbi:MAG TPA: heme ABC exporter ATP-binding protein CcmA [Caulobacteraceae bacterium]|jgi:heme exporter protein A